jgi:hypothetical protein
MKFPALQTIVFTIGYREKPCQESALRLKPSLSPKTNSPIAKKGQNTKSIDETGVLSEVA